MKYSQNRFLEYRLLPVIKKILGAYAGEVQPATYDQDTKQATDLVLVGGGKQIACRIRRSQFIEKYRDEFTIRSSRDTVAETELAKIKKGFGDWFFYGFCNATETEIPVWNLINLDSFREHLKNPKSFKHGQIPNSDGTTSFMWCNLSSFPTQPPILIASSSLST